MANKIILKKSSVAAKVPLATDLEVGEIAVNLADKKLYSKNAGGTVVELGNTGNVSGAASSTDNAIARFDGTTGKVIQNSAVTIDDGGRVGINSAPLSTSNSLLAYQATLESYVIAKTGGTGYAAFEAQAGATPKTAGFGVDNSGVTYFYSLDGGLIFQSAGTIQFTQPGGYIFTMPTAVPSVTGQALVSNTSGVTSWATVGNVSGAASSTDNAIARFDSTTGKLIQNSSVNIRDDGAININSTQTDANVLLDVYKPSAYTQLSVRADAGYVCGIEFSIGTSGLEYGGISQSYNLNTGSTPTTILYSANDISLSAGGSNPNFTINTSGAFGIGATPSYGTAGQVLTSQGASAAPAWSTPSSAATVSATAPASPTNGQLWYDSTNGVMMVYYGSVWVEDYQSQLTDTINLPDMDGGTASTTSWTYSLNCGGAA
jgi:hypothetical protein